jgi:hypothetical protein
MWFKHGDLQVPEIQGVELASAIRKKQLKAYYLLAYIRACTPGISPCVTATCTGAAM